MQAYEELKQQNDEVSKSSSSTSSSLDSASACEPELSELEGVTSELKRPLLSQYGEEDPFVDKYKTELGNTPRKRQQQSGPGIRLCFFALCIVLLVAISIAVTALTLGILDVRIKPLAGHGAPEKAIVLASYSGQNLSWLNEIPDECDHQGTDSYREG